MSGNIAGNLIESVYDKITHASQKTTGEGLSRFHRLIFPSSLLAPAFQPQSC